jgi:hypothetical protein
MVTEDSTAFVEQLEVLVEDKRAVRQRRRVAKAEIEVLELSLDLRLAEDALKRMLHEPDEGVPESSFNPGGEDNLGGASPASEREVERMRGHLKKKRAKLGRKRARLNGIREKSDQLSARQKRVTVFRFHSARHHVDCSEEQYVRMFLAQRSWPTLVWRPEGRRWWWYLGRFWWTGAEIPDTELKDVVDSADLDRTLYHHLREEARAHAFKENGASSLDASSISDALRLAVWRRDGGRCVDCGTLEGIHFEYVARLPEGAVPTANDVQLVCRTCSAFRTRPGSGLRAWD